MNDSVARSERSFGLSVGGAFIVIAALSLWRGRIVLSEVAGCLGVVLVLGGLLYPPALRIPCRLWWKFAHALGWFNTRLLLTVLFFLILCPLGLYLRLSRRDPMNRRRTTRAGWRPYPLRYRDPQHYTKMY